MSKRPLIESAAGLERELLGEMRGDGSSSYEISDGARSRLASNLGIAGAAVGGAVVGGAVGTAKAVGASKIAGAVKVAGAAIAPQAAGGSAIATSAAVATSGTAIKATASIFLMAKLVGIASMGAVLAVGSVVAVKAVVQTKYDDTEIVASQRPEAIAPAEATVRPTVSEEIAAPITIAPRAVAIVPEVSPPPSPSSVRTQRSDALSPAAEKSVAASAPDSNVVGARVLSLNEEVELLENVRGTLKSDPRSALALLDSNRRALSQGTLSLEADVLRIEALVASHRKDEARSLGNAFLSSHPEGPLRRRVEELLAK